MARLDVVDGLGRAASFSHTVLSYVGTDGYPMSVAGSFKTSPSSGLAEIFPLTDDVLPEDGQRVNLTFSHIRPIEGVGYDERRYVSLWGTAASRDEGVLVSVDRASGWDEAETPFFEYCERSVPRGRSYLEGLGAKPRLGRGWLFFLATRIPFLTATIIPVSLGGAVAASHGRFSWSVFLLTLFAACAVHLGLNVANDLFDDSSGADRANVTPTPFSGGSRVIQYGLVSRRAMLLMSGAFYTFGIGTGVWLAVTRGRALYLLGAAGIALSLAYSAPPLRLASRGLGEIAVGLGFGPVMTLGAYYALAQRFNWEALYLSLPVGILIALVVYVNEIPDRAGDSVAGKRNLVVRWADNPVIAGYALSAGLAYALIAGGAVSRIMPFWTLAGLLTIPMAVKVWRELRVFYRQPYGLIPAMQRNIGVHLLTGFLILAGYLTTIFWS